MRTATAAFLVSSSLLLQQPAAQQPGTQEPNFQQPSNGQQPAGIKPLDVLKLKTGDELRGHIRVQTADYIEIQLDDRSVVGFHPRLVAEIHRAVEGEDPGSWDGLNASDQWFSLVDDGGRAVGWLHSTVTVDDNGSFRLSEEWQFAQDRQAIAVTWLEQVAADGSPIQCYYRERTKLLDRQGVLDERIVTAEPSDGGLKVRRKDRDGEVRVVHPIRKGLTFPLAARASLRRMLSSGDLQGAQQLQVFDPSTLEMVTRRFEVGVPRVVTHAGKEITVRELFGETPAGRSAEWIDASSRTIRREINGPSLVALPTTEESARNRADSALTVTSPRLVAEPQGRFAMRLPDPMWRPVPDPVPGRVAIEHGDGSRATLIWMDHVDSAVALPSVTEQVRRWLQLLHAGVDWSTPQKTRLQAWDAMRIQGEQSRSQYPTNYQVHVVRVPLGVLVLKYEFPAGQQRMRAMDLERLLAGLELDPRPLNAPAGGGKATPPAPSELVTPRLPAEPVVPPR